MKPVVLIPQDVAEEGKNYLIERGYSIRMGRGTDKVSLLADIQDVDAVLFRNEAYDADVLEAAKRVKVLARHGVGVDKVDLKKAEKLGIWVTNGAISNSNTVAEMTLGFLIALGRNLVASNEAAHIADYDFRDRVISIELEGKILSLLGLGKIGKLVAQKAHYGLGMKIVAYDTNQAHLPFPPYVTQLGSFNEAFEVGDFVSAHYPAGGENNHSITKEQFSLMKPSAYFMNLARGELVVESDLIEVLAEGRIAGAGLDVFEEEPPKKDNPLLAMKNVLLTPHNAAMTAECRVRMSLHAAQGIDEVLSGKVPTWPMNMPEHPRSIREDV